MTKMCEENSIPIMSKTLKQHLEKYKRKILKLGFTPKRSFIVDSCDFILEEGASNEQRKNFK